MRLKDVPPAPSSHSASCHIVAHPRRQSRFLQATASNRAEKHVAATLLNGANSPQAALVRRAKSSIIAPMETYHGAEQNYEKKFAEAEDLCIRCNDQTMSIQTLTIYIDVPFLNNVLS